MRFNIYWASRIVGRKLNVFPLFYFVFDGNFQVQAPGAYIWRGDLTEGFLHYRIGGLIFGGAYTWRGLFSEFYGILRNVSLQFMGIFYLHLPSYSSLAKTWLSIRNRISPGLHVLHLPLYRMVDCSFSFLSQSIADREQKSFDFEELEITLYIQKSQIRLASGTGNPGWSRTRPELVCCEEHQSECRYRVRQLKKYL